MNGEWGNETPPAASEIGFSITLESNHISFDSVSNGCVDGFGNCYERARGDTHIQRIISLFLFMYVICLRNCLVSPPMNTNVACIYGVRA